MKTLHLLLLGAFIGVYTGATLADTGRIFIVQVDQWDWLSVLLHLSVPALLGYMIGRAKRNPDITISIHETVHNLIAKKKGKK